MSKLDSEHQTTFIQTLQQLIARMHSASQTSKQVCAGIVTAGVAVAVAQATPTAALAAVAPAIALWFIDGYYLSVERDVIAVYSRYVEAMHAGEPESLTHRIQLDNGWSWRPKQTFLACLSFSVWPYYSALIASALVFAFCSRPQC